MSKIQWTRSKGFPGRIWASNGLDITAPGYVSASIDGTRNSTELRVWLGGDPEPTLIRGHDGRALAKEIAARILAAAPADRRLSYGELDRLHAQHSAAVYREATARLRAFVDGVSSINIAGS